jgi:hypothetical protein
MSTGQISLGQILVPGDQCYCPSGIGRAFSICVSISGFQEDKGEVGRAPFLYLLFISAFSIK